MKTSFLITLLLVSIQLFSQGLTEEKLSVQKDFSGLLADVKPITSQYQFLPSAATNDMVDSDSLIMGMPPTVNFNINVEPLSYQTPSFGNTSYGHLMVSKGNYNTLGIQGKVHHKVDNYFSVDAKVSHDKWNENNVPHKVVKATNVDISTQYYITDQSSLNLKVGGSNHKYGIFSNQLSPDFNRDTINIKRFVAGLSYHSFNDDPMAFNYGIDIEYTNTLLTNRDIKENQWVVKPHISKPLTETLSLILASTNYLSTNIGMNNKIASSNNLLFKLNENKYTVSLGGSYNYTDGAHRFYPLLRSNLYLNNTSIISAYVAEEIEYNGLTQLLDSNPYLSLESADVTIPVSRVHKLALSSRVNKKINVAGQISYNLNYNQVNWNQSIESPQYFDNTTINFASWKAELMFDYTHSTWLKGSINLAKNIYEVQPEEYLFYRPEHEVKLGVELKTTNQKLLFTLEGDLADRQNVALINQQVVQSAYRYDISVGINYRPFEYLTVRILGSNLLNNSLEIFRGYEIFGRNASAHILFKF